MELTNAAASNDRRSILVALRDKLARTIDECGSGRDIAALSKRLMEVCAELESMPDPDEKKNPVQTARARARDRGAA